jgi:hypothetical protein
MGETQGEKWDKNKSLKKRIIGNLKSGQKSPY